MASALIRLYSAFGTEVELRKIFIKMQIKSGKCGFNQLSFQLSIIWWLYLHGNQRIQFKDFRYVVTMTQFDFQHRHHHAHKIRNFLKKLFFSMVSHIPTFLVLALFLFVFGHRLSHLLTETFHEMEFSSISAIFLVHRTYAHVRRLYFLMNQFLLTFHDVHLMILSLFLSFFFSAAFLFN